MESEEVMTNDGETITKFSKVSAVSAVILDKVREVISSISIKEMIEFSERTQDGAPSP